MTRKLEDLKNVAFALMKLADDYVVPWDEKKEFVDAKTNAKKNNYLRRVRKSRASSVNNLKRAESISIRDYSVGIDTYLSRKDIEDLARYVFQKSVSCNTGVMKKTIYQEIDPKALPFWIKEIAQRVKWRKLTEEEYTPQKMWSHTTYVRNGVGRTKGFAVDVSTSRTLT